MRGGYAADRIVGKAAALLYVMMGVKGVFAEVLSESALAVLNKHGVHAEYSVLTPNIINRAGDGLCPHGTDRSCNQRAVRGIRRAIGKSRTASHGGTMKRLPAKECVARATARSFA